MSHPYCRYSGDFSENECCYSEADNSTYKCKTLFHIIIELTRKRGFSKVQ